MKEFLDPSSRMKFECVLTGSIVEPGYDGIEISSVNFRSVSFFGQGAIENSVFNDCIFNDSFFEFSNFEEVTFLNCSFWDCDHDHLVDGVNFYNCKSNNEFVEVDDTTDDDEKHVSDLNDVEHHILTKIWPVGSASIERLHHFIGVILKTDEYTKKEVVKGIKSLKKRGILQDANNVNFVEVNKDKFGEIKALLGRD